ncbi:MAG: hypothetical protein ACR2GA_01080 [Chloroflexota bacterium]
MKYPLIIDSEAKSLAPGLTKGQAGADLTDSALRVDGGSLFHLEVDRGMVGGAALLPDPQPLVFLPPGVSMAPEQLGRDVICLVGARDGLVRIDFTESVEATTRPGDLSASENGTVSSTVSLQHLIISLDKAGDFVAALGGEGADQKPQP